MRWLEEVLFLVLLIVAYHIPLFLFLGARHGITVFAAKIIGVKSVNKFLSILTTSIRVIIFPGYFFLKIVSIFSDIISSIFARSYASARNPYAMSSMTAALMFREDYEVAFYKITKILGPLLLVSFGTVLMTKFLPNELELIVNNVTKSIDSSSFFSSKFWILYAKELISFTTTLFSSFFTGKASIAVYFYFILCISSNMTLIDESLHFLWIGTGSLFILTSLILLFGSTIKVAVGKMAFVLMCNFLAGALLEGLLLFLLATFLYPFHMIFQSKTD